jgi:hypothetical protein
MAYHHLNHECIFLLLYFVIGNIIVAASAALTKELMHYISPFLAVAELLRRTMWSCFRLENEHLSNHSGHVTRTHYDAASSPIANQPRRGWTIIVEVWKSFSLTHSPTPPLAGDINTNHTNLILSIN